MLFKGCIKQEPSGTSHRLPLTADLLSHCILTLLSGYLFPSIDRTLESMFLLAFFSFLRCSEFAPNSSKHNPSIHPCLSEISIFTLRRSKFDQFAVSNPIHLSRLNSFLSPSEPIFIYFQSRLSANALSQDPLFITESRRQATRFWFSKHPGKFCWGQAYLPNTIRSIPST